MALKLVAFFHFDTLSYQVLDSGKNAFSLKVGNGGTA